MSSQAWINLAYLAASMLFIVAFKLMTGPRTAVRGNYLGAAGMAIALVAACCEKQVIDRLTGVGPGGLVAVGVAAVIGAAMAATVAGAINSIASVPITLPSAKSTARCTAFSNSRTLPGQGWLSSMPSASGESMRTGNPLAWA